MIRQLRKKYHLTRKQLGELVGVGVTSIYLWETGKRNPSKSALLLLSKIKEELGGKIKKGRR